MGSSRPDGTSMIGFYAEFPKVAPAPTGIIINSEVNNSAGGGLGYGYNSANTPGGGLYSAQGDIDPAGTLIIPGAAPNVGAIGEILQLAWFNPSDTSYQYSLWLIVRGAYGSPAAFPFNSINIGGRVFNKSAAQGSGSVGSTARYLNWYAETNPLPLGNVPLIIT